MTWTSPPIRLTFLRGRSFGPVISADGTMVAFTCCTGLRCDIYVVDGGGGLTRLTDGPGVHFGPSFSPDGRRVAYSRDPDGRQERHDIHVAALEGGRWQLTFTGHDSSPLFSPDGARIVFQSTRDGPEDLYAMTPDGEDTVRLTFGQRRPGRGDTFGTRSLHPAFRPDGRQIAFISSRDEPGENRFEVYVMDPDGTGQRRLTHTRGSLAEPVYSPDGLSVAFIEWRKDPERRTVIGRVGADGSGQTLLEDSPGINHLGGFTPDGRFLVFTSTRGSRWPGVTRNWDLYALEVVSGAAVRLTENAACDMNPVVHPDGRRVFYRSDQDGDDELYVMELPPAVRFGGYSPP